MTTLATLTGTTVHLLGAGIDNMALLPHLHSAHAIRVWVDEPAQVDAETADRCADHGALIGAVSDAHPIPADQFVVRSPGFPAYRPDVVELLSDVPSSSVTTAVNLWLETNGHRHPTVIVTGTKGKSTVSRMLSALLPRSALVGNIGTPIWSIEPPPDRTPIICEVSSYQAVGFTHRADLAILTSLSEDHISWHGSVERYHADKLSPVRAAHRSLAPPDLAHVLKAHGRLRIADPPSPPLTELPAHMAWNAQLAATASEWLAADFDVEKVADPEQVLLDLPPMVGRLRPIPSADPHQWFDDSLASNPSGTAAAVDAFATGPIWLILGGLDRNVSLEPLVSALSQCSLPVSVVSVPNNGAELVNGLLDAGVVFADHLEAPDVAGAVQSIRAAANEPSTVLFSPAAPTPPQHGNWADRSAAFEAAVLNP